MDKQRAAYRVQVGTVVPMIFAVAALVVLGVVAVVQTFGSSVIGGFAVLVIVVLGTSLAAWRLKIKLAGLRRDRATLAE